MENPIKQFRKDHNLTQAALASLSGITEQVVLKTEQGLFPTLPPSIQYAMQILEPDLELGRAYSLWIESELRNVVLPINTATALHPALFTEFMRDLCQANEVPVSVNSLCTLLKIHPYVIQKFMKGKMKAVPVQLVERIAFIRGGFSSPEGGNHGRS